MSFIIPTGWTRAKGYPKIKNGDDGGLILVDQFFCDYSLRDIFNNMPDLNSQYDESTDIEEMGNLYLKDYTIDPTENKEHAIITMNYVPGGTNDSANISPEDGVPEYYLDDNPVEQPIEKHASYLTKWNNNLYEFTLDGGASASTPGWHATATDKSDATGVNEDGEYYWGNEKPAGGLTFGGSQGDWYKVEDRTKGAVESYILSSPEVTEIKKYKSNEAANTAAATVGTKVVPDKTFGKTGGEWLVIGARVYKDGKRYAVERRFKWATSWDSDIYS